MQANVTVTAFTSEKPRHLRELEYAPSKDGCTTIVASCSKSRPLYKATSTLKPHTVEVLVKYALERLAPYGIPDLASWNIEVSETDGYCQVDLVNDKGAGFSIDSIIMRPNRSAVTLDHGISARIR